MVNVKRVPQNNSSFLFLGALIVLGLGFLAAFSQRGGTPTGPSRPEIPATNQGDLKDDPGSIGTIIYGSKGDSVSLISAVNDSGNNNSPVTTLKDTIKFVTPLVDGKNLLFIADTDYGDMGSSFGLKEIVPQGAEKDGKVRTIYSPADDYKIDRYVISEDNKWIAWYEVKAADPGGGYTHESDYYRSYKAKLDEVFNGREQLAPSKLTEQKSAAGVQVTLPAIITNDGQVYFDTIIPSSYALYYGFKDEVLNPILPLNSYNSTPYLFSQKYLLYTAYNPGNSRLPSTGDTDSTRDQIVNTNIVKTYDLSSKQIVTVAPGDEGEHYKHPVYVSGSPDGEMSIVSEVYKIGQTTGKLALEFSEIQLTAKDKDGKFTKKTIIGKSDVVQRILGVGQLPSGEKTVIVGEEIAFRGNLGTGNGIGPSGYKNKLSAIKVYNLTTAGLLTTITPRDSDDVEYITLMPKSTQEKLGIERNKKLVDELATDDRQLKLGTFVPVEPKRARKNPRSECETEWEKKGYPNYEACEACPVYVYSDDAKKVRVSPVTPISVESAVPALRKNQWSFTADKTGTLRFDDGGYKKIDYDFPRGSVAMPQAGVVLSRANLKSGIANYAYSLGYNTREVEDIVAFYSTELSDASYVYFSHLPKDQAEKLLLLDISPTPDSYLSHIFYAKKLNTLTEITPKNPQFENFVRRAYTVVVWGSVIE